MPKSYASGLVSPTLLGGLGVNEELMNRGIRHAIYLDQLATGEVDRVVRFLDRKLMPDLAKTIRKRLARA